MYYYGAVTGTHVDIDTYDTEPTLVWFDNADDAVACAIAHGYTADDVYVMWNAR